MDRIVTSSNTLAQNITIKGSTVLYAGHNFFWREGLTSQQDFELTQSKFSQWDKNIIF